MSASTTDAAKTLLPLPGQWFAINGTTIIMPKKPYIMEGMPASSFTH